jgi:hypothetical protein
MEHATIGASAENDLQFTIRQAKSTNLVINDKATNVTNKGWTLKLWTKAEYAWTDAVLANQKLPALEPSEIRRIHEAVRNAENDCDFALLLLTKRVSKIVLREYVTQQSDGLHQAKEQQAWASIPRPW